MVIVVCAVPRFLIRDSGDEIATKANSSFGIQAGDAYAWTNHKRLLNYAFGRLLVLELVDDID